jgi:hypothetical protein
MSKQIVPVPEWRHFLDEFSRAHRDDRVHVERIDPYYGVLAEADEKQLQGVSLDTSIHDFGMVSILMGDAQENHHTSRVNGPVEIALTVDPRDGHEVLSVEDNEGVFTTIDCPAPVGMAPAFPFSR